MSTPGPQVSYNKTQSFSNANVTQVLHSTHILLSPSHKTFEDFNMLNSLWHIDKIAISYHFCNLITLVPLASLTNKCNFDKTICLCLKKGYWCSPLSGCLFTATNHNDKTKRIYTSVLALLSRATYNRCHICNNEGQPDYLAHWFILQGWN